MSAVNLRVALEKERDQASSVDADTHRQIDKAIEAVALLAASVENTRALLNVSVSGHGGSHVDDIRHRVCIAFDESGASVRGTAPALPAADRAPEPSPPASSWDRLRSELVPENPPMWRSRS